MEKTIIVIGGKQGSGKTTLADNLEKNLSEKFFVFREKFASVLYEMHDQCQETLKRYAPKYAKKKDGRLLQLLGTEWGRQSLSENIWCEALIEKVDRKMNSYFMREKHVICIIDDCRFPNEFDAFPLALRVRLEATSDVRRKRAEGWRDDQMHPSEIALDDHSREGRFDLTIHTGYTNEVDAMTLVLAQLDKKSWMEKRR